MGRARISGVGTANPWLTALLDGSGKDRIGQHLAGSSLLPELRLLPHVFWGVMVYGFLASAAQAGSQSELVVQAIDGSEAAIRQLHHENTDRLIQLNEYWVHVRPDATPSVLGFPIGAKRYLVSDVLAGGCCWHVLNIFSPAGEPIVSEFLPSIRRVWLEDFDQDGHVDLNVVSGSMQFGSGFETRKVFFSTGNGLGGITTLPWENIDWLQFHDITDLETRDGKGLYGIRIKGDPQIRRNRTTGEVSVWRQESVRIHLRDESEDGHAPESIELDPLSFDRPPTPMQKWVAALVSGRAKSSADVKIGVLIWDTENYRYRLLAEAGPDRLLLYPYLAME
jgi:hypothetical protein